MHHKPTYLPAATVVELLTSISGYVMATAVTMRDGQPVNPAGTRLAMLAGSLDWLAGKGDKLDRGHLGKVALDLTDHTPVIPRTDDGGDDA